MVRSFMFWAPIYVIERLFSTYSPTYPLPTATPTHKAALSTERLGKNSLFTAPPNCCNPFPKKNVKAFLRYWSRTRVAQAASTNLSVRTILPMQGLMLPLPLMAQTFTFKTSNQSSPKAQARSRQKEGMRSFAFPLSFWQFAD